MGSNVADIGVELDLDTPLDTKHFLESILVSMLHLEIVPCLPVILCDLQSVQNSQMYEVLITEKQHRKNSMSKV